MDNRIFVGVLSFVLLMLPVAGTQAKNNGSKTNSGFTGTTDTVPGAAKTSTSPKSKKAVGGSQTGGAGAKKPKDSSALSFSGAGRTVPWATDAGKGKGGGTPSTASGRGAPPRQGQ
jgi:hypothetical protein